MADNYDEYLKWVKAKFGGIDMSRERDRLGSGFKPDKYYYAQYLKAVKDGTAQTTIDFYPFRSYLIENRTTIGKGTNFDRLSPENIGSNPLYQQWKIQQWKILQKPTTPTATNQPQTGSTYNLVFNPQTGQYEKQAGSTYNLVLNPVTGQYEKQAGTGITQMQPDKPWLYSPNPNNQLTSDLFFQTPDQKVAAALALAKPVPKTPLSITPPKLPPDITDAEGNVWYSFLDEAQQIKWAIKSHGGSSQTLSKFELNKLWQDQRQFEATLGYNQQNQQKTSDYQNKQLQFEQQKWMAAQQLQQQTLAEQKQQRLATLAANPISWLQYSQEANQIPVVQPWMTPMLPQGLTTYSENVNHGQVPVTADNSATGFDPNTGVPYSAVGTAMRTTTPLQVGSPLYNNYQWNTPGFVGPTSQRVNTAMANPDWTALPHLAQPSQQLLARMSPSEVGMWAGYEKANKKLTLDDLQKRQANYAPPGGSNSGLRWV